MEHEKLEFPRSRLKSSKSSGGKKTLLFQLITVLKGEMFTGKPLAVNISASFTTQKLVKKSSDVHPFHSW